MYKIKSSALRASNKRVEGVDYARMLSRLEEVQKIDPQAKLLTIPAHR